MSGEIEYLIKTGCDKSTKMDMFSAILALAERVQLLSKCYESHLVDLHPVNPDPTHCTCGGPAWLPRETDSEGNAQLCCEKCGKQKAGEKELVDKYAELIDQATYASADFGELRQIIRDLIREVKNG